MTSYIVNRGLLCGQVLGLYCPKKNNEIKLIKCHNLLSVFGYIVGQGYKMCGAGMSMTASDQTGIRMLL